MAATVACRKCGAPLDRPDRKYCPACGTPTSLDFPVPHSDAVREFEHHESVLQNYRSMFLVIETFTASLAATRIGQLDSETLIPLLAVFGIAWLVIWIIITDLRSRVVHFFEQHDEDGALMRYHHHVEGRAHRAGFWFFTVIFPATFALLWLTLLLIVYGVV
jgi:hypothetical protein